MTRSVTVKDMLELLGAAGFEETGTTGSHHQYSKPGHKSVVTVPWSNKGDGIPVGTANSIAKAAGPQIQAALKAILGGGGQQALKKHVKALKQGLA